MIEKLSIVMMEPENKGNIGAVARVMKNFRLKSLYLVKPKVDHLSKESRCRAKHAQEILRKAKSIDSAYLKKFDYLIGTTARLGTDYNIPRSPLTPGQIGDKLKKIDLKKRNIALLIGREGIGLTNEEINMCDFVVTIPASRRYPTLNVSHACAILFYELFNSFGEETSNDQITPLAGKDKEFLIKKVNRILDDMEFATKEKRETQKIVWKRLIGKAMMTKREAFALHGFLNKVRYR